MSTLPLLKDLTDAIEAVQVTAAAATEAFKRSYAASVSEKVAAKVALMEAESTSLTTIAIRAPLRSSPHTYPITCLSCSMMPSPTGTLMGG